MDARPLCLKIFLAFTLSFSSARAAFEGMPHFEIDPADKVCAKDSDCEKLATQCSCSCGQGVNKNNIQKYEGKLDELCKDYHGEMCKMLCDGSVKCVNKACAYVRPPAQPFRNRK